MAANTLEDTLVNEFDKLKRNKEFQPFPTVIPNPELSTVPTACTDLRKKKTYVGEKFIEELEKLGVPVDVGVRGALKHEIAHWLFHPLNAVPALVLGEMAQRLFGDKGESIYREFTDIICNTKLILRGNNEIPQIYGALAKKDTMIDMQKLSVAYYGHQADMDLGIKLNAKLQEKFEMMVGRKKTDDKEGISGIQFVFDDGRIFERGGMMDRASLMDQRIKLIRYGRIVEEFAPKTTYVCVIYSNNQISDALRTIIREVSKGDYERILKYAVKVLGYKPPQKSSGKGIGIGGGNFDVDESVIEYYAELSRAYPIFVAKKPMLADSNDPVPMARAEWEPEDDPKTADLFSSNGKLLPGITQKHIYMPSRKADEKLKTPHTIVIIDSSGSMENPATKKSFAVAAGCVIARTYLENESDVCVANFSGDTYVLPYTRNQERIFRQIVAYQGGGTEINFAKLRNLFKEQFFHPSYRDMKDSELERLVGKNVPKEAIEKNLSVDYEDIAPKPLGEVDIFCITDGGIANLDETLEFLHNSATAARTHVIHVGAYFELKGQFPADVSIYRVDKPEDIMNISIGVLHQYFGEKDETGKRAAFARPVRAP
ncbi:MAG: VWA domain-containing protein [DPANN group archaeon]|nr:VWA domain-containing protein [DPANN group archaeon]